MIGCAPLPPGTPIVVSTFLQHGENTSSAISSISFSSISFGTPAADRYIVAGISWSKTGVDLQTLDSATIGGISAARYGLAISAVQRTGIIVANVPTGTTGTITVAFSGNVAGVAVSVYSLVGCSSAPTSSTWNDSSNPNASLAVPVGGVALGFSRNSPAGTPTWTNLVSDYAATISAAVTVSSASLSLEGGSALLAMQSSASATDAAGSFATFGPP